ncbi:MAG TPA: anti-sigma factor, partial [Beijerinckiaceae bacterium]|nr:anti-sigma factor [Beijerinckiaceae bacterium]
MTGARDDDERLLVHAYLDGELDPAAAVALERRMAEEPALAAERGRIETLRGLLQEHLPPDAPPPDLRRRIEASLGLHATASKTSWRAMAASVAVGAFIAGGSTWALLQPQSPHDVSDAIVASHIRGLMATQATDVASSDRHTVKPWFNGRIPQAPRVVDLSAADFPLLGGRIDVIDRTPVPTLVYRRRQHVISLTAVPSDERAAPRPRTIAGYNMLSWSGDGV